MFAFHGFLFIYFRKMAGRRPGRIYKGRRLVEFGVMFTFSLSKPKLRLYLVSGAAGARRTGTEL